MTDFDTRLRARLEHLDAAIPPVTAPSVVPIRPRIGRPRQAAVLLAATLALMAGTAVLTWGVLDPAQVAQNEADEIAIREDLGTAFGDRCLGVDDARALVRQRLDAIGFPNWTITVPNNYGQARCIGAAPAGDAQEVWLLPSMGGDVMAALEQVATDLLRQCLGDTEARQRVTTALNDIGVTDFSVDRGEGSGHGPDAASDNHVANGCHVFSGAQFDQNGRYTYYVQGP